MSQNPPISWFEEFLGIAYRYFDVRMNIVLMFSERKPASSLWFDTIHAWNDHTIKIRFVETGADYWFVIGADTRIPETNKYVFVVLPRSEDYKKYKIGDRG